MLERLNGMFAFAIWDAFDRRLFLARDRMGVKPLYYVHTSDSFMFASEEKALFAAGVTPSFDHNSWAELICFRYVAGEKTPFSGVKRLLPGHYLTWEKGRYVSRRWWNLSERAEARRESLPHDLSDWFQETFDSAVKLRQISDVPVGVLLSGGLDSSSIAVSLASQSTTPVSSFTVRFGEPKYDEGPLAHEVVAQARLKHHEVQLSRDRLAEVLRRASWLNDEPLVHGNDPHLLAISEHAKPRVSVLLSGEGADETLGGYVRYRPLRFPGLLNAARPILPRLAAASNLNGRVQKLGRFLSLGSNDNFVLFNACEVLPPELEFLGIESAADFSFREQVLNEAQTIYPSDPVRQAMYSDQHTFLCSILDRNDRMTMGASIECRTPFLDFRLVEMLAALPTDKLLGRQNKQLLRDAVGMRLPQAIRKHHKWGFGVPWGIYLREIPELSEMVRNIHQTSPVVDGPLDTRLVKRVAESFLNGETQYDALMRQQVMVAVWYESCIKAPAKPADPMPATIAVGLSAGQGQPTGPSPV
jgi:asparagine synthase (glutamine-hydrolysing)